jgi:hypothetical protein
LGHNRPRKEDEKKESFEKQPPFHKDTIDMGPVDRRGIRSNFHTNFDDPLRRHGGPPLDTSGGKTARSRTPVSASRNERRIPVIASRNPLPVDKVELLVDPKCVVTGRKLLAELKTYNMAAINSPMGIEGFNDVNRRCHQWTGKADNCRDYTGNIGDIINIRLEVRDRIEKIEAEKKGRYTNEITKSTSGVGSIPDAAVIIAGPKPVAKGPARGLDTSGLFVDIEPVERDRLVELHRLSPDRANQQASALRIKSLLYSRLGL